MKHSKGELLSRLNKIEHLSKGSKLDRLFNNPFRYLDGLLFWKLNYNKTKKGRIKLCKTFFDNAIEVVLPAGMDLYLLGAKSHDSEIRLAKYLIKKLGEGDTFIDIGAHFGYYSLLSSYLVGLKGKVIGIEASPSIFQVFAKNAKCHSQLKIFNIAAAAVDKELTFFEFPVLYSEYNTVYPEQFEHFDWLKENMPQKVHIQGKPIDNIINGLGLVPKIIKIDVEGAEYDVIEGLEHTIEKYIPIIVMEYLLDKRENSTHRKAVDFLFSHGYRANLICENGDLSLIDSNMENKLRLKCLNSDNIVFYR